MIEIHHREPTPNPNAFKFMADTTLVQGGSLSYAAREEAAGLPLAAALFDVSGVTDVYLMEDFVSVAAEADADWDAIERVVREKIADYVPLDATMPPGAERVPATGEADDPVLFQRINNVIDEMVRPALAGDGGGLEIVGLEKMTVKVRYQGACGSCPSATSGTLYAIENLLKTEVDERLQLVSA